MLARNQLAAIPVCPAALELVPEVVAREFCVLAVAISNEMLYLILPSDIGELLSSDETGIDRLRFILGREFTYDLALRDDLFPVVDLHYWSICSDIRNCDVRFQTRCPKQWVDLRPTSENAIRYCTECQQNVYFCQSSEELKLRTANNQCVAFCDADTYADTLGLPLEE